MPPASSVRATTHDPATVVHHYVAVNLARRLMNMTRLMRDADL